VGVGDTPLPPPSPTPQTGTARTRVRAGVPKAIEGEMQIVWITWTAPETGLGVGFCFLFFFFLSSEIVKRKKKITEGGREKEKKRDFSTLQRFGRCARAGRGRKLGISGLLRGRKLGLGGTATHGCAGKPASRGPRPPPAASDLEVAFQGGFSTPTGAGLDTRLRTDAGAGTRVVAADFLRAFPPI